MTIKDDNGDDLYVPKELEKLVDEIFGDFDFRNDEDKIQFIKEHFDKFCE